MKRIHLCRPDREAALLDELGRVFPASRHHSRSPCLIESELASLDAEKTPSLAFATQCVPDPEELRAASVSAWVKAAAERLIERLAAHEGPWRLHVYGVEYPGAPVRPGRCALIDEGIRELLKKKQRRLLRALKPSSDPRWSEGEALAQLALETPEAGVLSVCPPDLRVTLRRCLSQFPGGEVEIPSDRRPPSRAYLKLLEAELRMGRPIAAGESCVDLGASPGGWSFVALERGAKVIAVDRSPLRDDLMENPRLRFVRGDAFGWEPEAPVDWLLCDLIAFPERTLELLERWLSRRLCKRFCVTMKFRGDADYPRIEELKRLLERWAADFNVRQLTNNKNEVTAMGVTAGD